MDNREVFNKVYLTNEWGQDSGTGSLPFNAKEYINYLNGFIKFYNVKTILDLGSGDTKILRSLDLKSIDSYKCIEVSDHAIKTYYGKLPKYVEVINDDIVTCEYPQVDLVLIKDVLQHLDFESIQIVMEKIFKSCKYALITNDIPSTTKNINIKNGAYRGLNLKTEPFLYTDLQIVKTYKSDFEEKMVYLYRGTNEAL